LLFAPAVDSRVVFCRASHTMRSNSVVAANRALCAVAFVE